MEGAVLASLYLCFLLCTPAFQLSRTIKGGVDGLAFFGVHHVNRQRAAQCGALPRRGTSPPFRTRFGRSRGHQDALNSRW